MFTINKQLIDMTNEILTQQRMILETNAELIKLFATPVFVHASLYADANKKEDSDG